MLDDDDVFPQSLERAVVVVSWKGSPAGGKRGHAGDEGYHKEASVTRRQHHMLPAAGAAGRKPPEDHREKHTSISPSQNTGMEMPKSAVMVTR